MPTGYAKNNGDRNQNLWAGSQKMTTFLPKIPLFNNHIKCAVGKERRILEANNHVKIPTNIKS